MARRGNSSSAYRLYDEDTAALRRPEKRNHPTIKQKKEAPAQDRAAGRWSLRLIDSALNLDKVEQVARNDLGMAKPEKYQTVYVNIKGDDYVEVAKDASGDEEKGGKQFYATIIQTLGNVLEYLY